MHIHVYVYVSIMNKVLFLSAEKLSQGFATSPVMFLLEGTLFDVSGKGFMLSPYHPKSRILKMISLLPKQGKDIECWGAKTMLIHPSLQYILVVLAVF